MSLDIYLFAEDQDGNQIEVFSRNITHNLGMMADVAGLYEVLWRPDEHGYLRARDIISILDEGIAQLKSSPANFQLLNPSNGWGDYFDLIEFAEYYLNAYRQYPSARIEVSR